MYPKQTRKCHRDFDKTKHTVPTENRTVEEETDERRAGTEEDPENEIGKGLAVRETVVVKQYVEMKHRNNSCHRQDSL
jgi:hypothetical protein